MTTPNDVGKSEQSPKFAVNKLTLLMILAGTVIIFAVWFVFISDSDIVFTDASNYLVDFALDYNSNSLIPNCHSSNGMQLCPEQSIF